MPEVVAQADASEMFESQHTVAPAGAMEDAGDGECKKLPSPSPTMSTREDPALSNNDESASQGSNPNVVVRDLEVGPEEDVTAEACEEQPSKRGAIWRWRRLIALTVFLLGLGACLSILFYPRDPSWRITKLDIDTARFASVIMGQGDLSEPLTLAADVEFKNPNFIGTTTEPGDFTVLFGGKVMSWGTVDSCTVGPKSTSTMRVDVTVQFDEAMAQAIVAEVMANNMELKVQANALVVAKVGPLRIKTRVHCDVTASTIRLFANPADILSEQLCTYSYSL